MIKVQLLCLLSLLIGIINLNHAQKIKRIELPSELKEVSGLVYVDSSIVALNDGGNSVELFFLTVEGKIKHTCTINNAENYDWESLTIDTSGHIYIADCGNNMNNRTYFTVYKVSLEEAQKETATTAERCIVKVPYRETSQLKPHQLDYDVEAMNWENDQLIFYTKSRAKPWHGKSYVYQMKWQVDSCRLNYSHELLIGKQGWMVDAVTGSDMFGDTLVLLTYKKLVYIVNNHIVRQQKLPGWRQREGLAIDQKGTLYIASERQLLRKKPSLEIQSIK